MTAGVITGEAVELDIRLARWPSRLLAQLIDLAAQFCVFFGLLLALTQTIAHGDIDAISAILVTLLVVVFFGYPTTIETLWRGRSLGKAALGIRVVRDDGAPERFRQALFRALMFVVVDCWGPGLIVSMLNGSGKRIGDLVAGTIVVQDRVPGGTRQPIPMPAPLAWWAASLDLNRLDDDLALSCRQFLYRQDKLHAAARENLGQQLVTAVAARVWPPPPPGTPGWAYLAAVLAERRRRTQIGYSAVAGPAVVTNSARSPRPTEPPPRTGPPRQIPPPAQPPGPAPQQPKPGPFAPPQ